MLGGLSTRRQLFLPDRQRHDVAISRLAPDSRLLDLFEISTRLEQAPRCMVSVRVGFEKTHDAASENRPGPGAAMNPSVR